MVRQAPVSIIKSRIISAIHLSASFRKLLKRTRARLVSNNNSSQILKLPDVREGILPEAAMVASSKVSVVVETRLSHSEGA